jgi:signal transduction histidine kinase
LGVSQQIEGRTAGMSDIGGTASHSGDSLEGARAEELMRYSESSFEAQYKGLPIPVYTWQRLDDDFVLIDYNYAAEEITQGNVVHLLGARASRLYGDTPGILEEMWQCFREQSSFQREMLYQFRSTSDTKHLSVSYAFVPPDIVLVHTADVTKRVEAEQALERLHGELERRVQKRTAELERANEALRAEIAKREGAQQESERSHQRESVLNALLRISMEDIPLSKQLERALDEILSIPWLPVLSQGAIFLVGEDPKVLELQISRGLSPALQNACARVDFGQCLCGAAAASARIQYAAAVDGRHEIDYEGMEPHGHYCVPLLSGPKAIGTLVLYLDEGHPQDADEQDFLQGVGYTLAGIIERKWAEEALQASEQRLRELYAELEEHSRTLESKVAARTWEIEQRRQVAESLRGMLTVVNSDRPLDEILEHIVSEASRLLGSDSSAIYRLDGSEGTFTPHTVRGLAADTIANRAFPPDLSRALQSGEPVAVPDVTAVSVDSDLLSSLECMADCCQALLAVPLIVRGEAYGGLVLYYSEPREVSEEETALAVAFADQAALAIENARLHDQAREAAVMEERARLARELHDSVTQALFSMTLLAEAGQRLASAGELERVQVYLGRLGETSQQSLKEMRLLVYELRPTVLQSVGLVSALQQRLDAVEARAGVEARLLAEGTFQLPTMVEEELYRIGEQALNNALKHAAARSVTVRVCAAEGRIALEVKDNGRGFDPEAVKGGGGQGLTGMRERATRIGGALTVLSAPGQGTTVRVEVEIPVQVGIDADA